MLSVSPNLLPPVTSIAPADEPIALVRLDGRDPIEAASQIYRQVRLGRRVVAVVSGPTGSREAIATRLDAIGVPTARPCDAQALFDQPVALLDGPERIIPGPAPAPSRRLRVAIAGCGVVGGGVYQRLAGRADVEIVGVLVRDPGRARDVTPTPEQLFTDPAALLAREPDVLIDALSDSGTALSLIRAALARGVHVVSAGKQAIGRDLPALGRLARDAGAELRYSACVGGGTPMVEAARRAGIKGKVVAIEAVLNGTTNYVLERVAGGATIETALADARAAGFAEADATADLDGFDAVAKLSILAHEAGIDLPIAAIRREAFPEVPPVGPARQIARWTADGRADVQVRPIAPGSAFHGLADEGNALVLTLKDGERIVVRGRGAGRVPTVESVLADLADVTDQLNLRAERPVSSDRRTG